jgi:hypothetical protein
MTFVIPAPGSTFGVGDTIDISIEAEFVANSRPMKPAPTTSARFTEPRVARNARAS